MYFLGMLPTVQKLTVAQQTVLEAFFFHPQLHDLYFILLDEYSFEPTRSAGFR